MKIKAKITIYDEKTNSTLLGSEDGEVQKINCSTKCVEVINSLGNILNIPLEIFERYTVHI